MNDRHDLVAQTARSIFAQHAESAEPHLGDEEFSKPLWTVLQESGFTWLTAPDSGGELADVVVLARELGAAAAPVPLIESSGLAAWLVGDLTEPASDGLVTIGTDSDGLDLQRTGDGWVVSGSIPGVPWGRHCTSVAVQLEVDGDSYRAVLPRPSTVKAGTNLAGEPRDTLVFEADEVQDSYVDPLPGCSLDLFGRGALLRTAAMVGAMGRVLEMTVRHATDREQFGRQIYSFAPVQDHLVRMAEQLCLADVALDQAVAAPTQLNIGSAKYLAGEAANVVSAGGHQVHGAIGVTHEHQLHLFTKRLWSWQTEFKSGEWWIRKVGRSVAESSPANLWSLITDPGWHEPSNQQTAAAN